LYTNGLLSSPAYRQAGLMQGKILLRIRRNTVEAKSDKRLEKQQENGPQKMPYPFAPTFTSFYF
jgi:hypothetical protein